MTRESITCHQNLKPQDPQCLCKTPGQVVDAETSSYGYASQNPQAYRLRVALENDNSVLQNNLTGDFVDSGDGLCNPASRYYCIGSEKYAP